MTTKKNSLLFKVTLDNEKKELFNVTFKESTPKSLIEDLYETFKIPQQITIKDEVDCTIQINKPLGFRQLVTLYPMPFDINTEQLKTFTNKWGILKHYEFGKHKKCPLIHNPYLHLYFENFNRNEIPDQIVFRNRFIAVNVDGELYKSRCNYCKKTDHVIEDCPIKNQSKTNQPPSTLPQPKPTYAQIITSTPKIPHPPILHPSTKTKLVKQNIKKTPKIFPRLIRTPPPKSKKTFQTSTQIYHPLISVKKMQSNPLIIFNLLKCPRPLPQNQTLPKPPLP